MSNTPYTFSIDGTLQQAFVLAARQPDSDRAALLRDYVRAIVSYQVQSGELPPDSYALEVVA